MKEADIQTKIKKFLMEKGWLPVKIIQCTLNGWPDMQIHGIVRGIPTTIFLEIKMPGKKPTELQLYRHEQLRKLGFEVIVAQSIEDVKHIA